MTKLLFASNNKNKLVEIQQVVDGLFSQILTPAHFDGFEPEEDAGTFVGNALIKARYWHQKTGLPTLADDSGLSIHALDGWPGVETAPFSQMFGTFAEAYAHIWESLTRCNDKSATFTTVLVYIDEKGAEHIFEGNMRGHIFYPALGEDGYAFDYIFIPNGETQTVAQLGRAWKNEHSHRGLALKQFMTHLKE